MHARLTTGVLIDNGFELQYSRCWIDQEQDIVEFAIGYGSRVDFTPSSSTRG